MTVAEVCSYYQGCLEPARQCGYCPTHCGCGGWVCGENLVAMEAICQMGRLHSKQCCVDHDHHSMPHVRCIMR